MKPIADLRRQYTRSGLHEADLDADPIAQFDRWMHDALDADLFEPTAVTVATTAVAGRPDARIVLLKHYDQRGFVFFTNYQSAKGQQIDANPDAAMVVYWGPLERQVRISGAVTKTSAEESDRYFASRPRGSQLGAWVSEQSRHITSRDVLEHKLAELENKYANNDVPRPLHWGGYCIAPESIEFWQGRENRLHDRLRYTRQPDGQYRIERLAP